MVECLPGCDRRPARDKSRRERRGHERPGVASGGGPRGTRSGPGSPRSSSRVGDGAGPADRRLSRHGPARGSGHRGFRKSARLDAKPSHGACVAGLRWQRGGADPISVRRARHGAGSDPFDGRGTGTGVRARQRGACGGGIRPVGQFPRHGGRPSGRVTVLARHGGTGDVAAGSGAGYSVAASGAGYSTAASGA